MKQSTRFFALCLALVMCTSMMMAGALGEATVAATGAPAEATATQDPGSPDDILATVNGIPVLRSDMQTVYDSIAAEYAGYGYDITGMEAEVQQQALESAVQMAVWNQKVKELGFDVFTEEELAGLQAKADENWNYILDENTSYFLTTPSENPTEEELTQAKAAVEAYLKQMGYTKDSLLDSLKNQESQEKVAAFLLKDAPAITDEDVKAEYDTKVAADKESFGSDVGYYEYMTQYSGQTAWYIPEGMRGITHILLAVDSALLDKYVALQAQLEEQNDKAEADTEPTEDPAVTPDPAATATAEPTATPVPVTQEDLEAAKAEILASVQATIDEIQKKLDAGESFASLVEAYGTDPGMKEEPAKSSGYSVHLDSQLYDPAFVAGAFAPEMQKIGDIGKPIVSSFGVHILCYQSDVPGGAVELTDELKASLLEEMTTTQKSDAISSAFSDWMNAATVVYTNAPAPTAAQ